MICSQQLPTIVGHIHFLGMQLVWFSFVFQYHSLRNKRSMLLWLPFCRKQLVFHKLLIQLKLQNIQLHMSYQRCTLEIGFVFLIRILLNMLPMLRKLPIGCSQ